MGRWKKSVCDPDAYARQLAHSRAYKRRHRERLRVYDREYDEANPSTCPNCGAERSRKSTGTTCTNCR